MGNCFRKKVKSQTRGEVLNKSPNVSVLTMAYKSIIVIPRKNRLRLYIDGPDKYYRLRELRRVLPAVVVKVGAYITIMIYTLKISIGNSKYTTRNN